MKLTYEQNQHVLRTKKCNQNKMAFYLEEGVSVVIYAKECSCSRTLSYVVAPAENINFQIGCWPTPKEAIKEAQKLNLNVYDTSCIA